MIVFDEWEKKVCITAIQLYEADRTITTPNISEQALIAAEESSEALRMQLDTLIEDVERFTYLRRKLLSP